MIAHIEGILESKLPNQVVIDVNGIGYLLHISLNTYESLPSKGKLRLYSQLIVREDAHLLFGFAEGTTKSQIVEEIKQTMKLVNSYLRNIRDNIAGEFGGDMSRK